MTDYSRRAFLSSVAMTAAVSSLLKAQTSLQLSMYFTGLAIFVREPSKMTIGLLDHDHETIVVANKNDVTATGTAAANSTQQRQWRSSKFMTGSLIFMKGTDLQIKLTGASGNLTGNALNVFPLKSAATPGAALLPDWQTKCQTAHTFTNGNFRGITIYGHAEKCRHENQVWTLIDDAATVSKPHGEIISAVQHDIDVRLAEFKFPASGSSMVLKKSAPVLILQVPKTPTTSPDLRVAKDCVHYYTLLMGHTGPDLYPQRPPISVGCAPLVNVDPVYCPPAEF